MVDGYMPISQRQRLHHSSWWQTLGIVALMLATASMPLAVAYGALADHQSLKVEWAITGPACPTPDNPIRFHRRPMVFSYQEALFTRQYGNVFCVVVPDKGMFSHAHHTACQFSGPAAISVTTGSQTILYEPGIGRTATVTIRDGRPSCVIGGWFR
jgi:hypothetical protein